jgi:hypothetical protein
MRVAAQDEEQIDAKGASQQRAAATPRIPGGAPRRQLGHVVQSVAEEDAEEREEAETVELRDVEA